MSDKKTRPSFLADAQEARFLFDSLRAADALEAAVREAAREVEEARVRAVLDHGGTVFLHASRKIARLDGTYSKADLIRVVAMMEGP
jgi:microsomal dipeptidase-like Zn-dependent dipeptidase